MNKRKFVASLAGFSLLLGATSASAQMLDQHSTSTDPFQRIEQPFVVKAGVAIAGIALIGLDLWWFLKKR